MNNNNNQIGRSALEQIFTNEANINQMLSIELVTTSQLLVQFNATTNMIPSSRQVIDHLQLQNNTIKRHEGRRRRRQRQRQRRAQQRAEQRRVEQQRLEQYLRQSQREYQRWRQEQRRKQQSTERQQQQPVLQPRYPPSTMLFEYEWDYDNWKRLGYPEYIEENNDEHLEAYNLEKMDPKERWEQEQLNEFESFIAFEQLLFTQDEIEQENFNQSSGRNA